MPKITYKPEGAQPKVWEVPFGRFMSSERIVVERESGLPWGMVKGRLFAEDTSVIRALLYVLLKRENPTLKIDQVEFCEDDIELDATAEERAQAIEQLQSKGSLNAEEQDALEELLREQAADESAPKEEPAPSTSASDSTT